MLTLLLLPLGAAAEERLYSYQVTLEDAERVVAQALVEAGAAEMVAANITSSRVKRLYHDEEPLTLGVRTLQFDDAERQFSANLFILRGEDVLSAIPVSGRYEELIMVPVLKTRLHRNDVIDEDDIEEVPYVLSRIRKDTALSPEELAGKMPRRVVSPGRPVRLAELTAPKVLEKGATVQMRFGARRLSISTLGEALEPGALGESIRVRNHDSGTVVQARVVASGEVLVGSNRRSVE